MARYMKDEINFHGFLTTMRRLHKVTLEQVCQGLCSISMMKRIESGERLPDKLMRDRLMLRMGVALEGYEDYLSTEEYKEWEIRQRLLKAINEKEINIAKSYLAEYRKKENCSTVENQFLEAMEFMLLQMENAPIDQQKAVIERAVKLTIPDMEQALDGKALLSEQEINLITEYLWLREDREKVYFDEYEKILIYIHNSLMDYNGRAKTYPKAAFYLCRRILDRYSTLENLQRGLKICHLAIEILRESEKAYYFVELLEVWQNLVDKLKPLLRANGKEKAVEALLVQTEEKKKWKKLLKELYAEYNAPVYMQNFCYLYWETESYCIGEVIRTRRNMLGMTKEQLCAGVCSIKTLTRIELKKAKTQMPIVRKLFERLGLCAEYTRARVITNDYETLKLADELAWYIINDRLEEWQKGLEELENRLCMEIPQNRQFIMSGYHLLERCIGGLDKEGFRKKMLETLEYTIPPHMVLKAGKKFLSRDEAQYIYNIGMEMEVTEENPYIKVIEEICEELRIENRITAYFTRYEFFLTGLCSYLGNIGQYELSNELSTELIKESLIRKRIGLVAANIYNNFWNDQQTESTQKNSREKGKKQLIQCALLSKIYQTEKYAQFYEKQMDEYYNEQT
ncbi:MAG: hypothetical protein PUI46_00605 [Lachnospiraceae bacterium]|nr:hypothetical protein [Lachnospiraceae bacterium]MDY5701205.1 hypothetical protein [Lachnospiraceae bacterium]